MKKKKQIRDPKNCKFDKRQQKKIAENFGSFLDNFLSEYEEKNKDWVTRHFLRTVFHSLRQLKYYIDDPREPEISWENPFAELQYPVETDWEKTNLSPNALNLQTIRRRIDSKIETPTDLEKVTSESFLILKDVALFRELTGDIAFIVKDEDIKVLLPSEVLERLEKEVPKEDYGDAIEEISTKEFYFPLTGVTEFIWKEIGKAGITREDLKQHLGTVIDKKGAEEFLNNLLNKETEEGKEFEDFLNTLSKDEREEAIKLINSKEYKESLYQETEDHIYLKFSGLTINLDEKKAYYPIVVGLFLPSITQLIIKADVKTQNEIMNTLWEGMYSVIETGLEKLDKQEKYPERAFTTLLIDNETFAIPSNPLMFTLLAMFSGRPERIPRNLLEKPHNERTPEEKEVADQYINSIFDKQTSVSYDKRGEQVTENKVVAVISDNPKVEAKTEIGTTLFGDDLSFKEGSLAIYIKRTFGAEGLRHLLAILIGLDDAGRTGEYVWSVNEHLDRLGYKKMKVGAYAYELKQTALEIIKIFTSLFITATNKDKKGTGKITGRRLFHIEGFEKEYKENWVVDEKLTVKASDYWYKNSFESSEGSSQQFTKLLKEIARENHREHALTIYLAPLLAVFWRINSESRDLSVRSLMEWCDIDFKNDPQKRRTLKNIESELEYMKFKGYLGSWENKTMNALPSESNDPLNCILAFYPPDWLKEEFKLISSKKEMYLDEKLNKEKAEGNIPLTKEEFKEILDNSGLSKRQFANSINVSPALITRYANGERGITNAISQRIRDTFQSVDKK